LEIIPTLVLENHTGESLYVVTIWPVLIMSGESNNSGMFVHGCRPV
jgi:hypothetical protein